jgi:hypothetical protein
MEHHFHTPILFGFEGLIEIRAVSEIGAAVGDEESGVDFLFLNELGQGLEITLHVRLAAAYWLLDVADSVIRGLARKLPLRVEAV